VNPQRGRQASTAKLSGVSQAGHSSSSAQACSPQLGHATFRGRLHDGQRSPSKPARSERQLGHVASNGPPHVPDARPPKPDEGKMGTGVEGLGCRQIAAGAGSASVSA
jgi:hypothetical protein